MCSNARFNLASMLGLTDSIPMDGATGVAVTTRSLLALGCGL
jgi:hypothetical protein